MNENNEVKKNLFFISVTDAENSDNRSYSDLIYKLCCYTINNCPFLKSIVDIGHFQRHDMKKFINIKNGLSECLVKSDAFIVLLDCVDNTYNPNVWFELGVVAAYQKPVVLIAMENTTIPFDVNDVKIVKIKSSFIDKSGIFSEVLDNMKFQEILHNEILSEDIYQFSNQLNNLLKESLRVGSPFSSWFNQYDIEELGYYSVKDLFTRSGIIRLIQNPDVRAEYIAGEKEAFKELISEVSKAQESLRTSRFANQSIVTGNRKNTDIHNEFMTALHKASERVKKCDRIICNNHPLKWNDILNVISHSTSNMRVFVRQSQYDIGFELVIVDEKIAFIHFYQIDTHGDENENGDTYRHEVEVINSTLKIRGESVCKKLANIFDRLHHRDFDTVCKDPSRTLLGIPRVKELNDQVIARGVFQLNNYPKYTTDELIIRSKSNEAIKMFVNAFKNWDISSDEDKQNMAVGLCLLEHFFEDKLDDYVNDKKMADNIRKQVQKYRQEIQELQ